ncbi:Crp/Fnr family transcriptional regulator [Lacihabitans lacunae]|uniref:Crp/Fnr family transcriptional regulator n=1 Tax=Lacihabitans lacunae TaxID=1028214 RepID=A0ABV7YQK3_9BACT
MNELRKIVVDLIDLTEREWLFFSTNLKIKAYKAKTQIVKEGSVAKNIYFIESGLVRTYHLHAGKEINTYFACDHQFISTFSSFINQSPSFETLETIQDSVVYELSYQFLNQMYKESRKFEKLGRILAEKNYLCVLDRTYTMQTKTAKEKYLDFIQNYDEKILRNVPQYQIASFLGIEPESLSRIRKEISST